MYMSRRLLVTGFVPFSIHETNISEQILETLSTKGISGVEIETSLLNVDEHGSQVVSERLYGGDSFAAILHLGLSEKAEKIQLERFGKNRYGMKIPDNSGRQIREGEILIGSKDFVETLAPIHLIEEIIHEFDEVCWSEDAGVFICNETYYRTLIAAIESDSSNVLFAHLPQEYWVPKNRQLEVIRELCKRLCSNP